MDKREEIVEVMRTAIGVEFFKAEKDLEGDEFRRYARAALSALELKGYAIVPAEPTPQRIAEAR